MYALVSSSERHVVYIKIVPTSETRPAVCLS